MKKILFILPLSILLFSIGCEKSLSPEEQFEKDVKEIKAYLSDNGLTAVETNSGLHYIIEKQGTGNFPYANDNVTVRYKGYTLDGKVFDQSKEEGATFNLQSVIKGWTEGIQKFKEGGKGMLLIPSKLAYGDKAVSSIKPNSVLIFDVELLTIVE